MSNPAMVEGFEETSFQDLILPKLKIIQPLSTQILEEHPGYKIGDIYNTLTEESYPGRAGIVCSLIYRSKSYIECKPFTEGGEIIAFHNDVDPNALFFSKERRSYVLNGNNLIECIYNVIHTWEPFEAQALVIMARTQLKVANIWLTLARMLRNNEGEPLSIYEGLYNLNVVDQIKRGLKFKGWNVCRHTKPFLDKEQVVTTQREYQIIQASKAGLRGQFNKLIEENKEDFEGMLTGHYDESAE